MNYERKYKEALEKAQKALEVCGTDKCETARQIFSLFPELKESEDEKIRKEILHFIKKRDRSGCDYDYDKWIAWLEKQGEQEPSNKVEPKFKAGDWVVTSYGKVNQVIAVDEDGDGFTLDDYTYFIGPGKVWYHLWTIQDAKDGDVLACPIPKGCESGEQIFIFKGINSRDYVDNCIEYYCRVYEGVFYENENGNGYMGTTSSPLYPATKEQRNILFAKMKEAGYEWNTEKKELKKISQRMVSAEAKEALYDKPAWSEEDEDAIRMAIIALEDMYDEDAPNTTYGGYNLPFNKAAERLKSIKERYTWKPSDEQMRALHDLNLTGNISYAGQGQVLIELYNDLKKLTE